MEGNLKGFYSIFIGNRQCQEIITLKKGDYLLLQIDWIWPVAFEWFSLAGAFNHHHFSDYE